MKSIRFSLLLAILASIAPAFGKDIEIRVSVKVIVSAKSIRPDLADKTWPTNLTRDTFIPGTPGANAQDRANVWMANYGRGYRFVLEVVPIGGDDQAGKNKTACEFTDKTKEADNSPSCWYDRDSRDDDGFYAAINKNPTLFQRRSDQVNFYATQWKPQSNTGGQCPIPGSASNPVCYAYPNDGPFWLVHETGHFFGLNHTFGTQEFRTASGGVCSYDPKTEDPCTKCAKWIAGDDGIKDTLPDQTCWTTKDQVANNSYSMNYSDPRMTTYMKNTVDDTFKNTMSYHDASNKDTTEDRLTELQLDKRADIANGLYSDDPNRVTFVTGRTLFVSSAGSDSGSGTASTSPYRTVAKALSKATATGTDIILLRPGAYKETMTISKPCTLRATRLGPAAVGASTIP